MKKGLAIVWLRNDLRIHDNETLYRACTHYESVLPVYCLDTNKFAIGANGFRKIGAYRAKFLLQSLNDLKLKLNKLGGKLLVECGLPEAIIPQIVKKTGAKAVYVQKEVTSEELNEEIKVEAELYKLSVPLEYVWGLTLFHKDDIPFTVKDVPDVFTAFRKKVESECTVRSCVHYPKAVISPIDVIEKNIPTLKDLGFKEDTKNSFKGGETHALARINEYFWQKDLLKCYKLTRNQLLGWDYSSKFSAWLANGSLSPRYVYEQVKKYELERVSNDSTYWLLFELMWRDYFKFAFKKHGNKFFKSNGIKSGAVVTEFTHQELENFDAWKNGETGQPFVDANMRELAATGYMSNRGRQNVASFLVHDMGVNWLLGAYYFEEMLIDYDVCSNFGNWAYIAGVGNDPRENRKFNVEKQAKDYDPKGDYVKFWMGNTSLVG